MRQLLLGGGALPVRLHGAVAALFPCAAVMTAYGMTEGASSITYRPLLPDLQPGAGVPPGADCVGRPPDGIKIAIRGLDSTALTANESTSRAVYTSENEVSCSTAASTERTSVVGEVLTLGPHLMSGYWHNAAATGAAFLPGAWFRTGDLGCIDGQDRLWLAGRLKDVVRPACSQPQSYLRTAKRHMFARTFAPMSGAQRRRERPCIRGGEGAAEAPCSPVCSSGRRSAPQAWRAGILYIYQYIPTKELGYCSYVKLKYQANWSISVCGCAASLYCADHCHALHRLNYMQVAALLVLSDAIDWTTNAKHHSPTKNVVSTESVRQHCRQQDLTSFRLPRIVFGQHTALPVNSSGKVLKHKVREQMLALMCANDSDAVESLSKL